MVAYDKTGHPDGYRDEASQKTVVVQSSHCAEGAATRLSIFQVTRGHLLSPSEPIHWLGMHLGGPAAVNCSWGGPMQREVLETGSLYFRPADQPAIWFDESATQFLGIGLSQDLMRRASAVSGFGRASLEPRLNFADVEIERISRVLERELRCGEPNGTLFAEGLATALAARLVRLFGGSAKLVPPRAALGGRRLKRVLDYIEANLDASLSLERLSMVAAISPSSLKSLFRNSMETSVHKHVIARRVERARQLLSAGELTPSEVAFSVGFANQSHLARWTNRLLGATPYELMGRRG